MANRVSCRSNSVGLLPVLGAQEEALNALPHLDGIRVHREVGAMANFSKLHARPVEERKIAKMVVLLAEHEHLGAVQRQELIHQRAVVRKLHHRAEYPGNRLRSNFMSKTGRIQR